MTHDDQNINEPSQSAQAPAVSVIMVSYHTGPALETSIRAVLKQAEPVELIIVDNGNPETVIKKLLELAQSDQRVQIKSGHGNIGFSRACNLGAKAARGDHILLLNPDTELPDNAIRHLLQESAKLETPWLLGAKILNPDGTEQRGSRRDHLNPWNAFVEFSGLHKLFPNNPKFKRFNFNETACPPELTEVPMISGAFMFCRRQDYWAIGGMDEGYFLHVEDVDFCFRFRSSGGTIYFTPKVELLHLQGTSDSSAARVEWSKGRGLRRYFWKNFKDSYPKPFIVFLNALIFGFYSLKSLHLSLRQKSR